MNIFHFNFYVLILVQQVTKQYTTIIILVQRSSGLEALLERLFSTSPRKVILEGERIRRSSNFFICSEEGNRKKNVFKELLEEILGSKRMFNGKLFYSLGAMTKKALFLMREEGAWNKGKKRERAKQVWLLQHRNGRCTRSTLVFWS